MTPEGVSATERASPLTETLPFMPPLEESISNRPILDFPASIHMVPFAWGPATDSRLPGARRIRWGSLLTEAFSFAGEVAEHPVSASAAAESPMSTVVRRVKPAIAGFLPIHAT